MTESKKTSDRVKLVMIPILGLVLLFVLLEDADVAAVATSDGTSKTPATEGAVQKQSPKTQPVAEPTNWPHRSLTAICAHNPFELQDPRSIIDLAFAEAGIIGTQKMKEITAHEFFPKPVVLPEDDKDLQQPFYEFATTEISVHRTNERSSATQNSKNTPIAAPLQHEPTIQELNELTLERGAASRSMHLQQRLLSLQNEPVRMFMKSRVGTSALLGNRKVTEGEFIEEGIRIAAIDRTGITFEIVDTPSTQQDMLIESSQ